MNPTNPGLNLVTAILLGMGIFIFISVLTLLRYFFGGRSPLRWNAEARVEAAQNPANLLQADREFQNWRNLFWFSFLSVVVFVMFKVAHDESSAVLDAVVLLLGKVWSIVLDTINALLASRGC